MELQKFKKLLKSKNYNFREEKGRVIVNHNHYVDLDWASSLPEGIEFNNVGGVYLNYLLTLPKNTKFNNSGGVYLNGIEKLPKSVEFNNDSNVFLAGLEGVKINYRGRSFVVREIDGYTMLLSSTRRMEGYIIHHGYYFLGGAIETLPQCYVAEKVGFTAHGSTIREAIEDLKFKELSDNYDIDDIVAEIKSSGVVTVIQYRLLTGACRNGVNTFLQQNDLTDLDTIEVDRLLPMLKNAYGYERFKELLQ